MPVPSEIKKMVLEMDMVLLIDSGYLEGSVPYNKLVLNPRMMIE
jgi:hypothetical protein